MMTRLSWVAVLCALAAPAVAHDIDPHRLPLGDGKISHAPKVGFIWACRTDPNAGGAWRNGPWIDERDRTFDVTGKTAVTGSVRWPHHFTITREGNKRVILSNDYPDHPTGNFPIARADPAFRYDTNPNRLRRQNIRIELPADPKLAARPHCAPGAVGIMLTGVALFNALDAPGRDALAHETQDRCQGHPQQSGVYHYHSLSSCIHAGPGSDGNSPLVGYAIDGFGIYGPYEKGRQLTTADLDACHGKTSVIDWDGRKVKMYHYVATADFPYTVGCLRGDYDRELVRIIGGPPPGRGRFGRRGPPGFGPPPGMGPPGMGPPPYGAPPPR
jgi:hypothetical protein